MISKISLTACPEVIPCLPSLRAREIKAQPLLPLQSVPIKCWQHHEVCSVHWCQMKQDLILILPSAHKKLQKTPTRVHSYHSESQNPTGVGESQGMERERRCMEVKNRQMRNNSQESSILTETTTKKHSVTATSQGSPSVFPG